MKNGTFANSLFSLLGARGKSAGFERITMTQAKELMEKEQDYTLVDVRTPEEFSEGHIPGAINLPLGMIDRLAEDRLPDKNRKTLVYCYSGSRSLQAARILTNLGYGHIVETGGIMNWTGPVE